MFISEQTFTLPDLSSFSIKMRKTGEKNTWNSFWISLIIYSNYRKNLVASKICIYWSITFIHSTSSFECWPLKPGTVPGIGGQVIAIKVLAHKSQQTNRKPITLMLSLFSICFSTDIFTVVFGTLLHRFINTGLPLTMVNFQDF